MARLDVGAGMVVYWSEGAHQGGIGRQAGRHDRWACACAGGAPSRLRGATLCLLT